MNDLFDALRQSVYDYIYVDELPVRKQAKVRDTYSKFRYDLETVDGLIEDGTEGTEEE